jgi:uncharacterized tellurite resistance protein B-like protein
MFEWKKFLTPKARPESAERPSDDSERIRVATCAILLEVAEYDEDFSPVERQTIKAILERRFGLSDAEAEELIETSARKRRESRGLRTFTHFVNENYSEDDRKRIMEAAWEVIYADDKLNSYEDHFVHRLAKLLRLEHSDLIEAKLKAKYGDSKPKPSSGAGG